MVCSVTLASKGSLHTETSHPISIANKMTGLYITQSFTEKISEQTLMISFK